MKILDVAQGSPAWLFERAKRFCASDAPAMMGASKRCTRSDLLRMKATGTEKEFSEWAQKNLLDKGHETEARARTIIEGMLGEDLYPVTAADDLDYLLASFDGITMDGETGFEAKLWNEDLAAAVRERSVDLPEGHHWQLEQQALVGGLKRIIFVCTDGTPEKTVHMEYRPVPGRVKQLLAGWKQFEEDLANYKHVEVPPPVAAEPVIALPALSIQVQGSISLIDNLAVFGEKLKAFIEGLDKNPSDDQAFANAEAAVKTLQTAQTALEAAEASALAQTASIDEMRRTVALYREMARTNRLLLEKIVEKRKETIRDDIRKAGVEAVIAHIAALNKRLGKPYMPVIVANFIGVMKGKKTIASLKDAVATELARVKIEANEVADRIAVNLNTLREQEGFEFLFADAASIVLKANDDFAGLVKLRIAEHKEKEQKRLDQEREHIRKEEEARAQRNAAAPAVAQAAPVAAAPAVFNMPQSVPAAATTKAAPGRPTDEEIIIALALHYRVEESVVIGWLLKMDLEAASKRVAAEFA
jgi:predicted phage-related endonuclease